MKMSRFRLKTLLVAIALLSVPIAWVAYQLNWIQQRHSFIAKYCTGNDSNARDYFHYDELPWGLALFGETRHWRLDVPQEQQKRALELFPEAIINPPHGNSYFYDAQ